MSRYIAAYDIADDAIRQRVARFLAQYGVRLQRSVFEIWLDVDDLPAFRRGVGALLARRDEFDLIPIDAHPQRPRLRWQRPLERYPPVVVLDNEP